MHVANSHKQELHITALVSSMNSNEFTDRRQ